jgi:hypothetical protein
LHLFEENPSILQEITWDSTLDNVSSTDLSDTVKNGLEIEAESRQYILSGERFGICQNFDFLTCPINFDLPILGIDQPS